MITGKLINPRIIYDREGNKLSFDNTLVFEQDGLEIDRQDINLPYSMPDAEIETLVKQMVVDKNESLAREQAYASHATAAREENPSISDDDILLSFVFDTQNIVPQETLQWDWPAFDMEGA